MNNKFTGIVTAIDEKKAYRTFTVYGSNSQTACFTFKELPEGNACDLRVNDEVEVNFEFSYRKPFNNLFVSSYRRLYNNLSSLREESPSAVDATNEQTQEAETASISNREVQRIINANRAKLEHKAQQAQVESTKPSEQELNTEACEDNNEANNKNLFGFF